ncbi:MAG: alpha-mannosidase, partial [Chthonomonadaceae bacterium]|nr:alpha-mannosidase [Chthonomonadaceae bacterium]
MQKHPSLTVDRVRQFLESGLKPLVVIDQVQVPTVFLDNGVWRDIGAGFAWGPAYADGQFRATVTVPDAWSGRSIALCHGDTQVWGLKEPNFEATVWMDGEAVGGLDYAHLFCRLRDRAVGGEILGLELTAFAHNAETSVHGREKPRTPLPEVFRGLWLVALDEETSGLVYDLAFCLSLYEAIEERNPARGILLRAMNQVCNEFRADNRKTIATCRRVLKEVLSTLPDEMAHEIVPVGHAHLDTAWLWPLRITKQKMTHTTAIQLALADRYPEHVFVHSQASQYEWLEQDQPRLFNLVKRAVRKGQWEVLGSMWVEADCNLSGGESLIRQFLYGKRYFKQKFGVETIDMWLPDVFGYSAAIPQILSKFGIKAFLTQKLSWNQWNKIPHHTFWWQGIDGTSVWTHFLPADTYIGNCTPKEIAESVRKFKDAGRSDMSLYVYGYGDGGGGPTEQHLEFLRRARRAPGLPAVAQKKRASEFFREAMAASNDLCTWSGELYFELHRGTYTSQAANKRANRECEFLLRDAEWLAAVSDMDYPKKELELAWKLVLLNQFHDIIPGSSVREVYEDSARDYRQVNQIAGQVLSDRLKNLGSKLDSSDLKRPLAIFHNSVLPSQAEVKWDDAEAPQSLVVAGEVLPVQLVDEFDERKLVFPTPMAALGAVTLGEFSERAPTYTNRLKQAARRIENTEFAVRFDANGNITSLQSLDDVPTEFVAEGKLANLFQIFEDKPLFWDAWDIDAYALETKVDLVRSESFEVVERGPVRVAVELVKKFGKSMIKQRISLGPTPGVRFDTWIDWQEDERMLKVAFPLSVNSQRATFEIQYGHVERPTHRNTTWDMAKFEVCAQKWADLSESGHGAALINTGKYGYDSLGDTLRLTLLRSPKAPDPMCDMGIHKFTYVLLPHYGPVQQSEVVAAAYAVNAPVRA